MYIAYSILNIRPFDVLLIKMNQQLAYMPDPALAGAASPLE